MTGKRWGVILALALVLGVIAIVGLVFGNWSDLGQSGPGTYPGSLLWAIPKAGASATFDDLSGRDASYLNRHNNGAYQGQDLTYVPSGSASSGPTVISVHPIGPYIWAATALNGSSCYGILITEQPTHPAFGNNYYAKFPKGTPCEARFANPSTVRDPNVPG